MSKEPNTITLWSYLGILLYDTLLVLGLLFAATIIYIIPYFLNADIDSTKTSNLSNTTLQTPFYKTYLFFIWFSFFAWFWTKGGQTLGLKAWHARVEKKDATAISLWQVVLRFFSSLAPWFVALFLYHLAGKTELISAPYKYWILLIGFSSILWSVIDKEGLSLHDRFSETRIVKYK